MPWSSALTFAAGYPSNHGILKASRSTDFLSTLLSIKKAHSPLQPGADAFSTPASLLLGYRLSLPSSLGHFHHHHHYDHHIHSACRLMSRARL